MMSCRYSKTIPNHSQYSKKKWNKERYHGNDSNNYNIDTNCCVLNSSKSNAVPEVWHAKWPRKWRTSIAGPVLLKGPLQNRDRRLPSQRLKNPAAPASLLERAPHPVWRIQGL